MEKFFRFFVTHSLIANLLVGSIVLAGIVSILNMKRDVYPKVKFGEVYIHTTYQGASPEDVEINVTNKIEEEVLGVKGLKQVNSFSIENYSLVRIVIQADENIDKVVKDIKDAVDKVSDFPKEVINRPTVTEISTEVFPVIEVTLSSPKKEDYQTVREWAKNTEKKLKKIPGISKIEKQGYLKKELKVEVPKQTLEHYQLSLSEVANAIKFQNVRKSGGNIKNHDNETSIITDSQLNTESEINNTVVRAVFDGPAIKVNQLAKIYDGFEEEKVLSKVNGKPGITLILFKNENADVIKTIDTVKKTMEELKKSYPKEISVDYSNDLSKYVRNRLNIVISNAIVGFLLVVVLLLLFFNLRTALWVAMGIPISLCGVLALFPAFDAYIEVVSLAAFIIVLGMLVDDGIVIAENVARKREQGLSPIEAAVKGVTEVALPVMGSSFTTMIAFIPLFVMKGILGKFIFTIPLVVITALAFSLIEAFVALPAHLSSSIKHLSPSENKKDGEGWFKKIHKPFHDWLKKSLKYKKSLIILFIIFFIGSIYYAKERMEFILFPSDDADQIVITIETPLGSSLEKTKEKTEEVEDIIHTIPKNILDNYSTKIGMNGEQGQEKQLKNKAMITVSLLPAGERDVLSEELAKDIRNKLTNLTGFKELTVKVKAGGPPVGSPIEIRAISSNDIEREKLTNAIEKELKQIKGVINLKRDDTLSNEQIKLNPDKEKLGNLGIYTVNIAEEIRKGFEGEIVASNRINDEEVDIRVLLQEKDRQDVDSLKELLIPNNRGNLVKIKSIATLEVSQSPNTLTHYDGDKTTLISGDIEKGSTTPLKVMKKIQEKINLKQFPTAQILYGGEADESMAAIQDFLKTLLLAAVGIYIVMVLLFNSLLQPFIVMFTIPFGIIGVILAFALHQKPIGFLGLIGIVGMCGVVVNGAIVLIDQINVLRKENKNTDLREVVAEATANRLRPVLLTSTTTVLGLLPLAYGIGGKDTFMESMALALGYGVLFSTPLTLILIPALYLTIESIKTKLTALFKKTKQSLKLAKKD